MKCKGSPNCQKVGRPSKRGMCRAHYEFFLKRRTASGQWRGHVEAAPVAEHLNALLAAGITFTRLRKLTGLAERTLREIPNRKMVWSSTADRVYAVEVSPKFRRLEGPGLVPVLGTRRRLQSLVAMGYTHGYLASRLGLSVAGVDRLVLDFATLAAHLTKVDTARRVDALWRELQQVPPPKGRAAAAARNRAAKRGWALPLAWDEDTIDDRTAIPAVAVDQRGSWFEDYLDLKSHRLPHEVIAKRLGMTPERLAKRISKRSERTAA